jgi:hypothetical protein
LEGKSPGFWPSAKIQVDGHGEGCLPRDGENVIDVGEAKRVTQDRVEADAPRKISPFDSMPLLYLIVKSGIADAVRGLPEGIRGDRKVQAGKGADTPESIRTPGQRAICHNLLPRGKEVEY